MNNKDIKIRFGNIIRKLRSKQGYTQESFALKCNIDRSYMGCIERGEKNISLTHIEKIANGLQITIAQLTNHL